MHELMLLTYEMNRRHRERLARRAELERCLYDAQDEQRHGNLLRPALKVAGRGMVGAGHLLLKLSGETAFGQPSPAVKRA